MVSEVSAKELEKLLYESDIELIDVREKDELNQTDGKVIPESKHIPYSELTKKLDEINYKDNIYIICRHGNSSILAGKILESYEKSQNSNIYSVKGGYLDWEGELQNHFPENNL